MGSGRTEAWTVPLVEIAGVWDAVGQMLLVLLLLFPPFLVAWLAQQKGRSLVEGFLLGLLLTWLGLVIEALLPSREERDAPR
jgi:hypothetical protein